LRSAKDKKNAESKEQNSAGKLNKLRMKTHTLDKQFGDRKVAGLLPSSA